MCVCVCVCVCVYVYIYISMLLNYSWKIDDRNGIIFK